MALEKTDQQREIYWGGIDNTTIPTMEKLAEEKKVTAELSRQEVITQRLLNIDDEIAKAKKDAANGTAEDIKKYKELKKEKRALMKEEAEHAKIMAKQDGKKYTLTSLQADLEEKIGDMLKEEVGWTTKLSSNLYTQGVAQKSFLMDRLQIVNTGQSIYDWGVRLTDVLNNGTENQKKWAQAMTPMVSMGGKMIDDAISLGGAYDNIGSGTFMDMTKSMDEQLKKAERYKDYVKKEIIPALKADQEQLEETLKTQKKGSEEWKKTKEQIEENKQEQKESNALAQENVDKAKNLTAEAKRQKVLHGQTASTVAFIAEPFEKMKTFFEKTKVGNFVSELVGIGDATEHFTQVFTNYVKDSLDPDNPMNFGLAMSKMWTKTDKNGRVTRGQFKIMFDKFEEGFSKLKEVFTGINKSLGGVIGPALAIVAVLMIAKKVAEMFYGGMLETRKEFGLTFASAATLQATLNATAMEFKMMGVSAEDVKAGAQGIMDNLGGIGQVTRENLQTFASLNATLGLSGESAGVLASQMMAVGAGSIEAVGSQLESVGALAAANGVAPAQVLEDVAGASEAFANFAKDGGENVFKAAISARKLGVSMETVAGSADALLDFESSIEAQMEASMLLGRSINTDKARELALAGDLDGMQREITKQIGTAAEYEKLNVVQRKSMAAAFGVSVSELGKMVTNQDKLNNMTEEQKKRTDLIASIVQGLGTWWTKVMEALKPIIPLAVGILSPILLIAAAFTGVIMIVSQVLKIFNLLSIGGAGLGDVIMFITGAFISYKLAMMAYNKVAMVQKAVDTMLLGVKKLKNIGTLREIATDKIALVGKKLGITMARNQYAWSWKTIGVNLKKIAIKVKDIALEKMQNAGKIISMGIDKARKAAAAAYLVIQNLSIGSTIRETAAMVWKNTLMVFSTAATWAATAAQWALNVAMNANPIGLIILGVIALVAVIVLLFKKFNLFPKIIGGVMKVFDAFKTAVMTALKIAFAPLFLAWKAMKAVGNFIGGLFGGGDKSTEAASSVSSGGAPEMHSGGVVKETGNAVVEKGEVVSTPQQQQQQQQQSSSTISTQAMEGKLDELIQLLGQSGPIAVGVGGVKSNTKSISDQIV